MNALMDLIYKGADAVAGLADGAVKDAIAKYGASRAVKFPDTAYFFPTIFAATGVKVEKLETLTACVGVQKSLITHKEELTDALNAGLSVAVGAEIIEGLKYIEGNPYAEATAGGIGFVGDPVIRALGVPLVTGDIPGVAVVLGEAAKSADVAAVVKNYQTKGLLTFLIGKVIDQCTAEGVKMGLDYRVIPLGYEVTAVIHVVTVAVRAALIFGALKEGDLAGLLKYTKERVPAFVNTFGPLNEVIVGAGAGAIALGFPVLSDWDVVKSVAIPGALEHCAPADMAAHSLELRNIKIKVKDVKIPVAYAAAFEGEIIRKGDMHAEFWSNNNTTAELVLSRPLDAVTDHKITIIGDDIDCAAPTDMALATYVEVAGKKMKAEFEPVLERKIHHWLNYMEGVMHTGQRNLFRIRVSKDAFGKGLRLRDFGEVIWTMMMDDFGAVVDKCQVTLVTDKAKAKEILEKEAMPAYRARDERTASMTDESVDKFYTCVLCQSFAPSHCCVVTPERLGLCGAVSWLDASATFELTPTGPSQPIPKTGCLDAKKGAYESVNRMMHDATHGTVDKVTLYSLLQDPMTSCGCFECICGIMPEAKGVIIVNREYQGETPLGMSFGELASNTGGGVQTPGFMGHGRHFISSKKFISAEGGIARIVWMPKELKDDVAEKLNKTAVSVLGINNFTDMICDETIATESSAVLEFLAKKGHPALKMDDFEM